MQKKKIEQCKLIPQKKSPPIVRNKLRSYTADTDVHLCSLILMRGSSVHSLVSRCTIYWLAWV